MAASKDAVQSVWGGGQLAVTVSAAVAENKSDTAAIHRGVVTAGVFSCGEVRGEGMPAEGTAVRAGSGTGSRHCEPQLSTT